LSAAAAAHTRSKNRDFFTSGSREADQRASQRMAKEEQLTGSGEGAGEKGVKKSRSQNHAEAGTTNKTGAGGGQIGAF